MKAIVEAHGGTVEKFIGDAVMAVFGVPVAHEDDALRACRAAVEMRDALPSLELEGRIGVMTGEVVTGTEERLATGDAVNVAARLQQAAQPGEVLVGAPVVALVGGAVDVDELEPLALKGKADPIRAFRLLAAREAAERHRVERFVGRERELALIASAWQRACEEQRCELVTIVGEAGVGKSHLVAEALRAIDGRVVQGRCLPYGEGITYWPVVEVLKQLDAVPSDPAARAALRSLLGQSEVATSAEEIAWAVRKLLEQEAPVVAVFDDIQWAEGTFLDLVEHVSLLSTGSPILVVCMARPELRERGRDWPVAIGLEPLGDDDVDELIGERVPIEVREAIASAASGNPLFVSEMIAMAQGADGDVQVPPTLRALLAARLDQLAPFEREVLERGAIEGEIFHRGAVQALSPKGAKVTPGLAALVRKQLIRLDKPQLAGEDGFRFRHQLICDAAYEALPKASRADLHQRFADWLEEHGRALVELDELLGYHLEQAYRYRAELGPLNEQVRVIGARAGERLTAAGRRAAGRRDIRAAVNLLSRALALHEPEDPAVELRLAFAEVLTASGQPASAEATASAAAILAAAAGDQIGTMRACLHAEQVKSLLDPKGASERLLALIEEAQPLFEEAGDELGMTEVWLNIASVEQTRGQMGASLAALEQAGAHARRAGDSSLEQLTLAYALGAHFEGPTPVEWAISWLDAQDDSLVLRRPAFTGVRAGLVAMRGDFDEARTLLGRLFERVVELGFDAGWFTQYSWRVETLAGDHVAAEREARRGYELLERSGSFAVSSTHACLLAQSLCELGRADEAEAMLGVAEEASASDDIANQTLVPQVRAKLLAQRGDHRSADRLARQAVTTVERTDWLDLHGDALTDLAQVLLLAGRNLEAATARERALRLYERKGNLVSAGRARALLANLRDTVTSEP
jgi:tetratricopeptide (TPR) repeat protein